MKELAGVLDELVVNAPADRVDWSDVRARSQRGRGWVRRAPGTRTRLVVSLTGAILLLALGGTAIALEVVDLVDQQERFHANAPDDPRRLGPIVEITSGDDWALIAWKSEAGLCLDFAIPGNSPFACGFPVHGAARPSTEVSGTDSPIHSVAGFVSGGGLVGGDGKTTIFGVAAPTVASVTIELRDGRVVKAPLYDAPAQFDVNLRFFIIRLSVPPPKGESPVRSFNAHATDGTLIERVEE
jgi:hypothetical protein